MDSISGKISDIFFIRSKVLCVYVTDLNMPKNHGTADVIVTDSAGNTVVCTVH